MNEFRLVIILVLLHLIVGSVSVFAQSTPSLQVVFVDSTARNEAKDIVSHQQIIALKKTPVQTLNEMIGNLQERGYLAVSVDSIFSNDSGRTTAYLYLGNVFKWAKLNLDSIPVPLLNELSIQAKDYQHQPVNPKRFAALQQKILRHFENNGYPFAHVRLHNLVQDSIGITADLRLDKGPAIKIDSIIVAGSIIVDRNFLLRYLGLYDGMPYDERKLKDLSRKIEELGYLEEENPWMIEFNIHKTHLALFLKTRKANQLNAIIGVQPNTLATDELMVTVDALVAFKNVLGYGENISATYKNLQPQSPIFHFEAGVPLVVGTPIGIEGSFDLFKRDTTFLRVSWEVGGRYHFDARDYIRLAYSQSSNRIETTDTVFVRKNRKLPDNVDVKTQGANLGVHVDKTDYVNNPQKGFQVSANALGLVRTVTPNNAIVEMADEPDGFQYKQLYDSVNAEKYQYKVYGQIAYYQRLFKNFILMVQYRGGYLSGKQLFQNELFQLGGFKILRGFDEQSIYANQYHIGTLEARVLLNRNSYFYIFSDNAFIQTRFNNADYLEYPVSLGMGITLQNKTGIFNFAVGLGKFSGTDFSFKQTKVHFGYIAYF